MGWQNRTVSPKREPQPKVLIRNSSPGLCRFAGMMSVMLVGMGTFYGASALFGLEQLDWAAPAWTGKHIVLLVVSVLLSLVAGVFGFGYAMTIQVRSERLNDFFIIMWQFLANGVLVWVMSTGTAMSASLGRDGAKAAVLHFGAERAILHVVGTGSIIGLLFGAAFFIGTLRRVPVIGFFILAEAVCLFAARWHFSSYGIDGKAWIVAGLVVPIVLLIFTPAFIQRDRSQRTMLREQDS